MDNETQANIDEYLAVYERVNPVVKNAEVTAAIIDQIGKDSRCSWMINGRSNGNDHSIGNGDVPATEKQIEFMKRLNIEVPTDCTKQEASKLIDEAKAE